MTLLRHRPSLLAALTLLAASAAGAFDLQGHRGARGLAPENTMAAFATACRLGVTTLELDTGVTRDGVLVVMHDPRLNPAITRDERGEWVAPPGTPLQAMTLAEVQRHDVGRLQPGTRYAQGFPTQVPADGERPPTLAAVLERFGPVGGGALRFNIETKLTPDDATLAPAPEVFAQLLVDAIRRAGLAGRATIQSFDWRTLREARRLAPEIRTVALTSNPDALADGRWSAGLKLSEHGSVPKLVKALGAPVWSPNANTLTEAAVKEAQTLGLAVVPWTVNAPEAMDRLIGWGVDGLISDYPDRLRDALKRAGRPLPPPLTGC